jgi:quercetin dioxygenase-like cupin family protein
MSTEHAAQHQAVRLTDHAAELLDEAREAPARRAARTLIGGSAQRVTMIALPGSSELSEHLSPAAASLQVISGEAVLVAGDREWQLAAGTLIAIPHQRHSLRAVTDTVVLLTVSVD